MKKSILLIIISIFFFTSVNAQFSGAKQWDHKNADDSDDCIEVYKTTIDEGYQLIKNSTSDSSGNSIATINLNDFAFKNVSSENFIGAISLNNSGHSCGVNFLIVNSEGKNGSRKIVK